MTERIWDKFSDRARQGVCLPHRARRAGRLDSESASRRRSDPTSKLTPSAGRANGAISNRSERAHQLPGEMRGGDTVDLIGTFHERDDFRVIITTGPAPRRQIGIRIMELEEQTAIRGAEGRMVRTRDGNAIHDEIAPARHVISWALKQKPSGFFWHARCNPGLQLLGLRQRDRDGDDDFRLCSRNVLDAFFAKFHGHSGRGRLFRPAPSLPRHQLCDV